MPSGKQSSKSPAEIVAYTDGGARGNPGPAAYGVVIQSADGRVLDELRKYLGETTNNEAEYQGLLAALEYALAHDVRSLSVFSDSELLVRQILKQYKVKSGGLRPLYERAQEMIRRLDSFTIAHVRREHNQEADRLVNETLDRASTPH
jgi:probable phosphoglycerate mutase